MEGLIFGILRYLPDLNVFKITTKTKGRLRSHGPVQGFDDCKI